MNWAPAASAALIVLCAPHFAVKRAVRSGIVEAHARIAGEKKGGLQEACGQLFPEERESE